MTAGERDRPRRPHLAPRRLRGTVWLLPPLPRVVGEAYVWGLLPSLAASSLLQASVVFSVLSGSCHLRNEIAGESIWYTVRSVSPRANSHVSLNSYLQVMGW